MAAPTKGGGMTTRDRLARWRKKCGSGARPSARPRALGGTAVASSRDRGASRTGDVRARRTSRIQRAIAGRARRRIRRRGRRARSRRLTSLRTERCGGRAASRSGGAPPTRGWWTSSRSLVGDSNPGRIERLPGRRSGELRNRSTFGGLHGPSLDDHRENPWSRNADAGTPAGPAPRRRTARRRGVRGGELVHGERGEGDPKKEGPGCASTPSPVLDLVRARSSDRSGGHGSHEGVDAR
jgi:hypothetical protein